MNAPVEPTAQRRSTSRNLVRRIAVSVILSGLVFLMLWIMAFSFATSLLIGSGICVVIIAASATLSLIEMVLDAIATIVFGTLAAIAAVVAAVFSLFGS
jgi:hypothetical protein